MNEYDATEISYKNGYNRGYADGVKAFADRIREKDRTWRINEIEKELLEENA